MGELISIIINVYNGEKYIAKCLESILMQTYKRLEILIINDGSTDNTLKICKKYNDERIRIITTKNMGLSNSRNIGIENANGKFLYFVDADDFVEKDVIEYLYELIKKSKAQIATCKPIDIYDYNIKIKNEKEIVKNISNTEMLKKVLLSVDRAGAIWNKLISKELFNKIRFENRIINDVVVTYKLVLEANSIVYSNQIKYYYFRHSDSIIGKKNANHLIDLYKASIERYEYIKNIYPNMIENSICLNTVIMTIYFNGNDEVINFLNKQNALKVYNDVFVWKVLLCKINLKTKIKLVLFRISPKLFKNIMNILNPNEENF